MVPHILYERLYSPPSGTTMWTRLPESFLICAWPRTGATGGSPVTTYQTKSYWWAAAHHP